MQIGAGIKVGGGITIQLPASITISSHPSSSTIDFGTTATFSVTASITIGATLSYQWQVQPSGGSWSNISGATSSSYTTSSQTNTNSGDSYRVIVSGTKLAAPRTSNTATLTVTSASITINSHPGDSTVNSGDTATFSVSASATLSATLSYQWQKQESGAGAWNNISGATSSSYTTGSLTVADDNTDKYRVVVSATKNATSVTSNSATLTVNSASTPNSIIVAQNEPGGYFYGASSGAGPGAFGTITSEYFNAVYTVDYNDGNTPVTYVTMTDGTYSGFTVQFGVIDNDIASYPRVFTINNTNYNFTLTYSIGYKYIYYGAILTPLLGTTVPASFDVALTPSLTSNSIIVAYWSGYGQSYFGASNGYAPDLISQNQIPFGTVVSDYINQWYFDGTNTRIVLRNGGPYMGGFSVSSGWISGDTTGSFRIFNINNINYEFTAAGSGSNKYYTYNGNAGNLGVSTSGSTLAAIYDPSGQGSGPNTTNGTITVGSGPGEYGWKSLTFGSGNFIPGMMNQLYYDGANTQVWFKTGTYTGNIVVDDSAATVGGQANVTVIVDSIQQIGALATTGDVGPRAQFTGDVFSLSSKNGQTLTVAIDAGGSGGGGGGGGSTTYTATTDYSTGGSGPPGISFMSIGGPYTSIGVIVDPTGWTNSAGSTALLALTSGSTFTVSAIPDGGGTAITSTITLTSSWASLYGSAQRADITASPPVSTSYPDYVPLSVTIGSGGGGTGTEVTLQFGFWDGNGPGTALFLFVMASNTAGIAAMDSLPSNATITLTDSVTTPSTVQVTMVGGFTKSGPGGPPGNESYTYAGTTSSPSLNPSNYQNLTTVTLPNSGGGGGGGGNTTVTLFNGYWFSDGFVSLRVLATDTAGIASMDAIPSGATLTISDSSGSTTITLSGALTKSGPAGPTGGERYFYDGQATTSNAEFPSRYGVITTVTY